MPGEARDARALHYNFMSRFSVLLSVFSEEAGNKRLNGSATSCDFPDT